MVSSAASDVYKRQELNANRRLTLELEKYMIKGLFQLVYGKRITTLQAKNTVTGIQHKNLLAFLKDL
jgi:hypothetical protein